MDDGYLDSFNLTDSLIALPTFFGFDEMSGLNQYVVPKLFKNGFASLYLIVVGLGSFYSTAMAMMFTSSHNKGCKTYIKFALLFSSGLVAGYLGIRALTLDNLCTVEENRKFDKIAKLVGSAIMIVFCCWIWVPGAVKEAKSNVEYLNEKKRED